MKWQSEESVGRAEATEWARHFHQLESDMDHLLADMFRVPYEKIHAWCNPGRYIPGRDLAEAGLAELIELRPLEMMRKKRRR